MTQIQVSTPNKKQSFEELKNAQADNSLICFGYRTKENELRTRVGRIDALSQARVTIYDVVAKQYRTAKLENIVTPVVIIP